MMTEIQSGDLSDVHYDPFSTIDTAKESDEWRHSAVGSNINPKPDPDRRSNLRDGDLNAQVKKNHNNKKQKHKSKSKSTKLDDIDQKHHNHYSNAEAAAMPHQQTQIREQQHRAHFGDSAQQSSLSPQSPQPIAGNSTPITTTTTPPSRHPKRRSLTFNRTTRSKTVGGKWSVNSVGQVIYKNHESYTLMRQIQMGLRTAVSDITPKKNRELSMSKDFANSATIKWSFPSSGTLKTPPHDYENFHFYDYCPMPFRHLRERFGIDASHFLVSLCHDKSLSILGTPGKSGALFFFSADMQYMLKTITKKESKFLRKILPRYYNHVMNNPSTLITRFYGVYSIKPAVGKNVRFVIMNNVFDTMFKIEERYDLKGSTIGRTASEKELSRTNPVLKDMDLLQKKKKIRAGSHMKEKLIQQLKADCKFLESMKIMDYSLLLGIHKFNSKDDVLPFDLESIAAHTAGPSSSSPSSRTGSSSSLAPGESTGDGQLQKESSDIGSVSSPESPLPLVSNHDQTDSIGSDIGKSEHTDRNSGRAATIRVNVVDGDDDSSDSTDAKEARPSSEDLSKSGPKNLSFLDSVKNTQKKHRPSLLNGIFRAGIREDKVHLENQRGHRVSEFQQFHGGILSSDGGEIYFLGIIDLLQMWNNRKQVERMVKGFKYDKNQISSVSPKKYAARFLRFVDETIE